MKLITKKRYFITGSPDIYPGEELAILVDKYILVDKKEKAVIKHDEKILFKPREISEKQAQEWQKKEQNQKLNPKVKDDYHNPFLEANKTKNNVNKKISGLNKKGIKMILTSLETQEIDRPLNNAKIRLGLAMLAVQNINNYEEKQKLLLAIKQFENKIKNQLK